MSRGVLAIYLKDHLAGSVAALDLLDHLLTLYSGASREPLTRLRSDIEADQRTLQQLLEQLGEKESQLRKAAAWLTAKVGEAKLRLDDPGNDDLRVLEALETLGLGIQGKLSLWRALAVVAAEVPALSGLDLQRLEQRAMDQFHRVDRLRLEAARSSLSR